MSYDRRKNRDVLTYVFECAIRDREQFLDCHNGEEPETVKDIQAFKDLAKKILGSKIVTLEDYMRNEVESGRARVVTMSEVRAIADERIEELKSEETNA